MKQFDLYDRYYYETFSEYFSELRSRSGKTGEEVASDLGIRPSTFFHYEKGSRSCPISVMKAMAEYYGKDFYEVFRIIGDRADEKLKAVAPLYIDESDVNKLSKAELIKKINDLERQLKEK